MLVKTVGYRFITDLFLKMSTESSSVTSQILKVPTRRITRNSIKTTQKSEGKNEEEKGCVTSSNQILPEESSHKLPGTDNLKVSSSKPKISRIEVNEMILDDGNKEKSSKRKRAKKDSEVLKTDSKKLVKKEAGKSSTSKHKEAVEEKATKPELVIPDILIPLNKPKIKRPQSVSPWNGTLEYNNKVYLGAHISAAGGLENAITNSVKIGGSSFALFLKNQRQWVSKPMENSTVDRFKAACMEHKFPAHLILPHGSYLMNCGSSDSAILDKSRATLLDEVQRCERLGILYYNIHPGSTCGKGSREDAIKNIADSINWVHDQTPGSRVAVVLENMCRQGHTIGGDFSEIAAIIEQVFDQSRIGVCLDTCHALAAGYDLATAKGFDAFLEEFERVIGFKYLVAVHLNDSEGGLGCHRDRHASIGKGQIGLEGFRRIINCPRFRDIPLVLETPFISDEYYKEEILLLKSLAESDTVCA